MNPILDKILQSEKGAAPVEVDTKAKTDGNDVNDKKNEGAATEQTPPANEGSNANEEPGKPSENTDEDYDDAKVLAALKKKGININSIEELNKPAQQELTEEEKVKLAEERRKQMLVYGLQTGKIKGEGELKKYITDQSRSSREIAFELFKAERLAEDKNLTEEELNDEFADLNFEYLEEDDKKRIRASKQMDAVKQNYLQDKYGHIDALESEFDEYLQENTQKAQYGEKIKNIFAGLPQTISFDVKDPGDAKKIHSYNFNIPAESLKTLQELYQGNDYFLLFSKGGMKDEDLQATVINSVKQKQIANIISEVANAHATAMLADAAKGRRGIQPVREEGSEGNMVVSNGISDQIINSQTKK